MKTLQLLSRLLVAALIFTLVTHSGNLSAKDRRWVQSTAYLIPPETAPDGEGYFAIVEGHNGRFYIGTHGNAVNSWLVEFDPHTEKMDIVVDAHKAIGTDLRGFGAQAKIHTRNNVGASGRIYFATKQGYPRPGESRDDYPGGYPMVYDPKSKKTRVYPIPVPHQGIISIAPDESRGLAYISTCSDERPIDGTHFMVLNLDTGEYRDLLDCQHQYAFVVVDHQGRAYHPILGGDIARYNPNTMTLDRLKQTIDGRSPAGLLLAGPEGHPINWDITPDRKILYAQPMSGNALYQYDLTNEGNTLPGHNVGTLIPGAAGTDCRAMCVGPTGTVWCAVTENIGGSHYLHLVSYRTGDEVPTDHGLVEVRERMPNFTGRGFKEFEGKLTTAYVIMGVCEGSDGSLNILAMHPYSVLRVSADQLR